LLFVSLVEAMEINDILTVAVKAGASDILLKAGQPPLFRLHGGLVPLKDAERLTPEEMSRLMLSVMNEYQVEQFKQTNESDFAHSVPNLGRFRVNVFQQRGLVGAVLRVIPVKIKTIEELKLPPVLSKVALENRGLILVTGTTGSGKSTTLAAMIDVINSSRSNHIITIEDPIEYVHRDKRSIVNQREVGVDTLSFGSAMRAALRQNPDVILVGEMRDLETTEVGLTAAETGHLVMSTLHTMDATETINRVVSIFPPHQQKTVRLQLASVIRAIICQRLVPTSDGKGRVAALEILRQTQRVRELIEDKDRLKEIPDAIAAGTTTYGMQTFDQSLMFLYKSGQITYEEAERNSSNPGNFALRVQGISSTSDGTWDSFEGKKGGRPPGQPPAPTPQSAPVVPQRSPVIPVVARDRDRPNSTVNVRPASTVEQEFSEDDMK
jgi:twitching motility protein PilT